jgi:hypothetical protein
MLAKYPYKFLRQLCKELNIDNWTKKRVGNLYGVLFVIQASGSGSVQNAKARGTFYAMRIVIEKCRSFGIDPIVFV